VTVSFSRRILFHDVVCLLVSIKNSAIEMGYAQGRGHSEDLGIDRRIILEWIFGKQGRCGLDSSGSG
jgi:hypothetical protein